MVAPVGLVEHVEKRLRRHAALVVVEEVDGRVVQEGHRQRLPYRLGQPVEGGHPLLRRRFFELAID